MDLEAAWDYFNSIQDSYPSTAYIKNANDTVIQRLYLFENLEVLNDKHFHYKNISLLF